MLENFFWHGKIYLFCVEIYGLGFVRANQINTLRKICQQKLQ